MFHFTPTDWQILAPVLVLAAGAILVLLADLFVPRSDLRPRIVHALALVALATGLVLTIYQYSPATYKESELAASMGPALREVWSFRMETVVGALLLQLLTFLVTLSAGSWTTKEDEPHYGEWHCLLLLFPIGGILLVSARHIMLAFLGLELLSISLYVLVAIRRTRYRSIEAALKYFLLGAFAAAIFLYGAALLYAGRGSLTLLEIGPVSRPGLPAPTGLAALGGALLFVALFFKASAVPFHMWTPDVYQGAPTPITALMSTGTKAAAFLLLLAAAPLIPREILTLLPLITIATIVIGNFGALVQKDVKRLIAYSGIAHAGYLLIAFTALCLGQGPQDAAYCIRAVLVYLVAYGVTNLAALFVIALLEKSDPSVCELEGLKGLARRNPVSAAVLSLAMLSLAGIPPTIGFWGKYQVFASAIGVGQPALAVVGILFSVVGLYYYLKIVVYCYFSPAACSEPIESGGLGARNALTLTGVAILLVGILPSLLLDSLVNIKL